MLKSTHKLELVGRHKLSLESAVEKHCFT